MFAIGEVLRWVTSSRSFELLAKRQFGNVFKGQWGLFKRYKVNVPADPRRWGAGTTTSLNWTVPAPPVPGKYKVLLNIADPKLQSQSQLPGSSETYNAVYAVRLANTGTWQPGTGFNDLGQTVTVG